MKESNDIELTPTGIAGFDCIVNGGLTAGKMYLLSGSPGTGKTTFSLQFIAEGIKRGERCMYIAVGGAGEDLAALAKGSGVYLDPELVTLHTVQISGEVLQGPEQRVFSASEAEIPTAMKQLFYEVKRVKPIRLVIDSLSDLRLLAEELLNYRRLILATRLEIGRGDSTVLITNNPSETDPHLETTCHGIIRLDQTVPKYGPVRRRLTILKLRGRAYETGWHDFKIDSGGLRVYPTVIATEHGQKKQTEQVSSANANLDLILGGGISKGSTTAIIGASGTGKTTVANQFVVAAAQRGERVAIYLFNEAEASYRERAKGLGLTVEKFIENETITIREVNVAEFSTGEFSDMVLREVDERGAGTIVIDTLIGYAIAMPDQTFEFLPLQQLLSCLSNKGVTALLAVEQRGVFGSYAEAKNVSYLADAVIHLGFIEYRGEIKRAISVLKKRRGAHETTRRVLTLSREGIIIGDPLVELQTTPHGESYFDL
jgi:circadian clock protein KaiC